MLFIRDTPNTQGHGKFECKNIGENIQSKYEPKEVWYNYIKINQKRLQDKNKVAVERVFV